MDDLPPIDPDEFDEAGQDWCGDVLFLSIAAVCAVATVVISIYKPWGWF